MSELTAERFDEFYRAVHGYAPFPWQSRVAARACDPNRNWPAGIALPTAAGKTACIDIAVFALACQAGWGTRRTAPRRIFFVVDRRIVVDQASLHANSLSRVLQDAESGVLREVADALRNLAGDKRPLDVYTLRGGMYRDTAWARSPLQPTVIASTVDQVGSRLLFRGYGVSDSMKPVHAGLVGNDALILLDEAHCARPFDQTVQYVAKYRQWGEDDAPTPFRFVSMTATPSGDGEVERDEAEDRSHPVLGPRMAASKPATLVIAAKAKGKTWEKWGPPLVDELSHRARELMGQHLGQDSEGKPRFVQAVGIIVNRVATARALAQKLREPVEKKQTLADAPNVILLTGRMRPVDRDAILEQLRPIFSGSKIELAKPTIVVATQCIEVGADLDFHALVTECASLDALRQRFGRLNRVAARPSATGVVVVRADQTDDTEDDPVYGKSLANTWNWLTSKSANDIFDFGVSAVRTATDGEDLGSLNAASPNAPVLFPAYLDCWVQTHPIPTPDPDPAVFLHGPQRDLPDVQVVFRADLGTDTTKWIKIVELCPPSSSEAVAVRLPFFRQWLLSLKSRDESGDVEGETAFEEAAESERGRIILCWKGPEKSVLISDPSDVRPGDTLVVGIDESDLQMLCDFPHDDDGNPQLTDCGDEAYQRSRDKAILRLWPLELPADDEDFETKLTVAIQAKLADGSPDWIMHAVTDLSNPKRRRTAEHPLGGWVVTGKYRLHQFDPTFVEDDESSESPSGKPVKLEHHSRGVADYARRFAAGCGLDADLYTTAGLFHDLGKCDLRFQAMLKGRSPRTAGGEPLAKSGTFGAGNRDVHRYPKGAQHELLSTALLATQTDDDLLLHLIATHHGSARPFAACVEENDAAQSPFTAKLCGKSFKLATAAQCPADWNAELPERFWRIIRRFGWWGAAYHEAVFRLADHAQSRAEQEDEFQEFPAVALPPLPTKSASPATRHALELPGLDGSNPLAFLAALGTLRLLSQATRNAPSNPPQLSWCVLKSQLTPRLHVESPLNEEGLLAHLISQIEGVADRPEFQLAPDLTIPHEVFRGFAEKAVSQATICSRETVDYAAAFGTDTRWADAEVICDTAFRTMAGAGHQHFLSFMQNILRATKLSHLEKTLFRPWLYDDPVEKLTLRWDPEDDVRYAFRWRNPSGDPSRKRRGNVLGANCLALLALPLFPTVPLSGGLATTGFRGRRASETFLTWPIWRDARSVDVVRSMLSFPPLQGDHRTQSDFSALNITDFFQIQRITIGKVRNFSPSVSLAAT